MAAPEAIETTNQAIVGSLTSLKILNAVGWLVFGIILIGVAFWGYSWYKNKKLFKKKITAFEIIGGYWQPVTRDLAKVVKIGKGGFEILFLKKLKTYKIAYGGRVGKDTYYFFIMPDGYWFNGMLLGNINKMTENGGLIPIVTTNPAMRGQYTSLEKQIDSLTNPKGQFWEKYGSWILSTAFILIAGVMLWLNYREYVVAMNGLDRTVDKIGLLLDRANSILGNTVGASSGGSGLVPA